MIGQVSSTIVLVETPSHVHNLLEIIDDEQRAFTRIVALTPDAEYALEQKGVSFLTILDYCNEEEFTRIGIANYDLVEKFCKYIDSWLASCLPEMEELGLELAKANRWFLKILFDTTILRLFILDRILERESPGRVEYFQAQVNKKADSSVFFGVNESIYSLLVPLVCKGRGISTVTLLPHNKRSTREMWGSWWRIKEVVRVLVHQLVYLRTCIGPVASYCFAVLKKSLRKQAGRILITSTATVDLQLAARELIKNSLYEVLWWPVGSPFVLGLCPLRILYVGLSKNKTLEVQALRSQFHLIWKKLMDSSSFQSFFKWQGIDFLAAIHDRVKYFFATGLEEAVVANKRAHRIINKVKSLSVVLSPGFHGSIMHGLARAFSTHGIPLVTCQHGEMGTHFAPANYYTDFGHTDYMLVHGDGVVRYSQKRFPHGATPIPVGSITLDRLIDSNRGLAIRNVHKRRLCKRLGLDPSKQIVIYITTSMHGNQWYVAHQAPSDTHHFRIHRRIVESFRGYPSIQFVVKLHPSPQSNDAIKQLISDLQMRNCLIVDDIPLVNLLPLGDLFIVDSPSTAFLEVMTTRRPVLVFTDCFCWEERVVSQLKREAVFSDDLEEFVNLMEDVLSSRKWAAPQAESALLKQFGTHLGDGRSADRVVAALREIISSHRKERLPRCIDSNFVNSAAWPLEKGTRL